MFKLNLWQASSLLQQSLPILHRKCHKPITSRLHTDLTGNRKQMTAHTLIFSHVSIVVRRSFMQYNLSERHSSPKLQHFKT